MGGGSSRSANKATASSSKTPPKTTKKIVEEFSPPERELSQAEEDRLKRRFNRLAAGSDKAGHVALSTIAEMHEFAGNQFTLQIFGSFDDDKDDYVSFEEFKSAIDTMRRSQSLETKAELAFKIFDKDADGLVSTDDMYLTLRSVLGSQMMQEQIREVVAATVAAHDVDKDNCLNYSEFRDLLGTGDLDSVFGYMP